MRRVPLFVVMPALLAVTPASGRLYAQATFQSARPYAQSARPYAQSAQQHAQSAQQHAIVTLVAARTAAVPGQPIEVGVHFEIDPHWHIYWRNPGDSGGPPTIEWKLPQGFEAGAFEWPAPQRIPIGGSLVNYGYEADVLLPLMLQVPASAKPGTQVDLSGRVKYLICSDLCVPARADITLPLTIAPTAGAGGSSPSPAAALFSETRKRLPQPAPPKWSARASFANRQFNLAIETGTRESNAQFFPFSSGQIDDSAPQKATPTPRGIHFTLRASDQLTAPPQTLSGVLVFSDGRAFTIDAPVSSSNGGNKRVS